MESTELYVLKDLKKICRKYKSWYLHQYEEVNQFPRLQDKIFSTPISRSFPVKFSFNIWAGIVDGYLVGPYIVPMILNGFS